jgi:galactonate dehydratase
VGEEFTSKWDFRRFIEPGLTDFVRVDICNAGGLTEGLKIAALAEAHYLDLMPHNPLGPICTAATAHLATAIPNFAWLEVRETPSEDERVSDDALYRGIPEMDGSFLLLSDQPGHGVVVNEDELDRRDTDWFEPPHLHRRDGSFTNW